MTNQKHCDSIGQHRVIKRPPRMVWVRGKNSRLVCHGPVEPAVSDTTELEELERLECVDCGLVSQGNGMAVDHLFRETDCDGGEQ